MWDDQVVRRWRTSLLVRPSRELPLGEHRREERVHRHPAFRPGFGVAVVVARLDDDPPERFGPDDDVTPPQAADAGQRVENAAVLRHARVRDERREFLAGKYGATAGRTTCPKCSNRCADTGETDLRIGLVFALRGGVADPGRGLTGWEVGPGRREQGDG